MLEGDSLDAWLLGDPDVAVSALGAVDEGTLGVIEVSARVNSVRNDEPANIEAVPPQLPDSLFD